MTLAHRGLAICLGVCYIATLTAGFQQIPVKGLYSRVDSHRSWVSNESEIAPGSRNFQLHSEKRHKEAIWGRKYTSLGTSSQKRHYRIVGRGGGIPRRYKVSGMPTKRMELPARRCMLLGKMDNSKARKISHSGKRTHRKQKVNLQWKRIWCISRGHYVRLRLSMKGLKTIKRLGLEEAARRFHLNIASPKLFAGYAHLRKRKETTEAELVEPHNDDEGTTDM